MSEFPVVQIFHLIEVLLKTAPTAEAGVDALIDECARARSHPRWDTLRRLPYADGARQVSTWLANTLREWPPPPEASGLWFGLFNPNYEDGTACDLYVCGMPASPGPKSTTRFISSSS